MERLFGDKIGHFLTLNAFNIWADTSTANTGGPAIYDFLTRNGIMKRDVDQVRRSLAQARSDFAGLNVSIYTIEHRAKALCVDEFFKSLRAENKKIEDFFK